MAVKEETQEGRGRLYGRKWKVTIYKPAYKEESTTNNGVTITTKERDPANDIELDVSVLRCVFKTNATRQTPQVSMCALEVYNMNVATEGDIIQEGRQIRIEAGYQEGQYGLIFEGDIVQVIRNRENGVDYKLEILALKGAKIYNGANFVRTSIAAGSKPREVIKTIAANADQKIEVDEISKNLSEQQLPRGKVIFGDPNKYLRDITIGNDAYYWEEDGQLVVRKTIDEIPEGHVVEYTPNTGLVGTPQYTDNGINITVLMDCRIKIDGLVKIDNEIIRRQLINVSFDNEGKMQKQASQRTMFDEDGEYQVMQVSHRGDTHGDTWVTEVVGMSRNGILLLQQSNSAQSVR